MRMPQTYILSPLFCFSKKRLFEELAAVVRQHLGLGDDLDVVSLLNAREAKGSTIFFPGAALPHTVIEREFKSFAVLCILENPVSYNSIDAEPAEIDVALAVFISNQDDYAETENLLVTLTGIFSNKEVLDALRLVRNEIGKISLILSKLDQLLSAEPEKKPVQDEDKEQE